MHGELANSLRRQVAQAGTENEEARSDLRSLVQTVDTHLIRLRDSVGAGNPGSLHSEKLVSAIQDFNADVKGRLMPIVVSDAAIVGASAPASVGTYDVLRHSLSDAQKRCQLLNGDMLRVADANEELIGTLKTLKGTNKRLVEEVQKQTEELSGLTQQRLHDMESLTHLEDSHRKDKESWAHEAQRLVDEEQRRYLEEVDGMRKRLNTQIEQISRGVRRISGKTSDLNSCQTQLKALAQGITQTAGGTFKKLERELTNHIVSHLQFREGGLSKLADREHSLRVQHCAEKEVRENEGESWKVRHGSLSSEFDELVARKDRDVSQLETKIESSQSARDAEAMAVSADRLSLHEQLEGLSKETAHLEAMMLTKQRQGKQLEIELDKTEDYRDQLQTTMTSLKQQIHESDEALGESYRSNEALREQMEVQRLDSHQANGRDLKQCRDMFEKRLHVTQSNFGEEHEEYSGSIHRISEQVALKAGEVQVLKENAANNARKRDTIQRDMLLWKAQNELAAKMKADVEREATHFSQECLGGELLRLQQLHDELSAKKEDLASRRGAIIADAQEAQLAVKAREDQAATRAGVVAGQHRDISEELQRLKAIHADISVNLAAKKADSATQTQDWSERREGLEQAIARLSVEQGVEKKNFDYKIQVERQNYEALRNSFEKHRNEHKASYTAACEGPADQLSALEGAITDLQRSSDGELQSLRHKSQKYGQRVDTLKGELARLQSQLMQTEQEVQEGTARVSMAKTIRRNSREALDRERNLKHEELQQAERSLAQRKEQLTCLQRTGDNIKKEKLRNLEEAKASIQKQNAEAEDRMHSVRSLHSAALDEKDTEHSAGETGKRDRLESLHRENEQLRKYVGEHRNASFHMQDVGKQMQKSLASIENRAAELRRDQLR